MAKLEGIASSTGSVAMPHDGSDFSSAEKLVATAIEKYGRIDGAICCSGSVILKPAHLTSQQEYEATMVANSAAASNAPSSWTAQLGAREAWQLAQNSFEASFVPAAQKAAWTARLRDVFSAAVAGG